MANERPLMLPCTALPAVAKALEELGMTTLAAFGMDPQ